MHTLLPKQVQVIEEFMMELGILLHRYGVTAPRAEDILNKLSLKLQLDASFSAAPTSLIASFRYQDSGVVTRMERMHPGYDNIEKLMQVTTVAQSVLDGNLTAQTALEQLSQIKNAPHLYSPFFIILSYGLISGGVAPLLGADLWQSLISILLGLVVGVFTHFTYPIPKLRNLLETFAAAIVTLICCLINQFMPELPLPIIMTAALITLFPGLELTAALFELASEHLAAGSARLTGALMKLMKLAFGTVMIFQLFFGKLNFEIPAVVPRLSDFSAVIGLLIAALGSTLHHRIPMRFFLTVLFASFLGRFFLILIPYFPRHEMLVFTGSVGIGIVAHLFQSFSGKPANIFLLPGILVFLPGSIGHQAVELMFQKNILGGLDSWFRMFATSAALVSGLFTGALIGPMIKKSKFL